MAGTSERAKKLKESRERAKEINKTKDRAPFAPKEGSTKTSPGSKLRKQSRPLPKQTGLSKRIQGDSKPSPGSKVRKEDKPTKAKEPKGLTVGTAARSAGLSEAQRQALSNNQAAKKTKKDPLAGKPRTIAAAKKAGQLYFFDKDGVKKLAVTKADLDRTGLSLREYANKYAPKKVTKKEAEKFKKKAGGGMMKKKGYAGGGKMKKKGYAAGGKMKKKGMAMGGAMKKKGMAAGGKMKKATTAKGGGMMMRKKKMMAKGGAMKKKGYAMGGAMKKKGMKKGGKTMKMRGGGLATRGTTFSIR